VDLVLLLEEIGPALIALIQDAGRPQGEN